MSLRHYALVAWQRADDLFLELHILSQKAFPAYDRFELGLQMRRAVYSVAANIVEGFARRQGRAVAFFEHSLNRRSPKWATASTSRAGWDTFRKPLGEFVPVVDRVLTKGQSGAADFSLAGPAPWIG